MPKIATSKSEDGSLSVSLMCPACERVHTLRAQDSGVMSDVDGVWYWNLSYDNPTFYPSLIFEDKHGICHSWIEDGSMVYLTDSTAHKLGGLTLSIRELR